MKHANYKGNNYLGSGMTREDYFWTYEDQGPPSPSPELARKLKARTKAKKPTLTGIIYEMIRAGIKGGIKIDKKGY